MNASISSLGDTINCDSTNFENASIATNDVVKWLRWLEGMPRIRVKLVFDTSDNEPTWLCFVTEGTSQCKKNMCMHNGIDGVDNWKLPWAFIQFCLGNFCLGGKIAYVKTWPTALLSLYGFCPQIIYSKYSPQVLALLEGSGTFRVCIKDT